MNANFYSQRSHLARVVRSTAQLACLLMLLQYSPSSAYSQQSASAPPQLVVKKCDDFEVNGKGDAQAWGSTEWVELKRRPDGELPYSARFKMLYSDSGVYVLFDGTDRRLTASMQDDFLDLWTEDVYECFFWTDEEYPVYFEYEISPLGKELPILIPNFDGTFLGWRPWHYEGPRKTRIQVSARGGKNEPMAQVEGWSAELFIPYDLLRPLRNVPPTPNSRWRANFYRVDHDQGQRTAWDWARVGGSFHEYQKFGTLLFE